MATPPPMTPLEKFVAAIVVLVFVLGVSAQAIIFAIWK